MREFGFISWVNNANWPPKKIQKLTFRALALRRSELNNDNVNRPLGEFNRLFP